MRPADRFLFTMPTSRDFWTAAKCALVARGLVEFPPAWLLVAVMWAWIRLGET